MSDTTMVPMDVRLQPAWLTWVSATTTCLKALGADCDTVDVAGMTGYAFVLSVHKELCPSGPTVFDWCSLLAGVQLLGRTTLNFTSGDCHTAELACDRTRGHCRVAYDLVAREIEAGRPCVVWGAYVPEFAVAIGVGDGCYHVKSFRQFTGEPEPPIPYDGLNAPGGPYALGFPTVVEMPQEQADARAIARAAQILNQPRYFRDYGYGPAAYDTWIAALDTNTAHPFGNAYNSACWTEGRHFAHQFLGRVASRNPRLAGPLGEAAEAYRDAADAMDRVAALFPFPHGGNIADAGVRAEAIEALKQAKAGEMRAAKSVAAAAAAL